MSQTIKPCPFCGCTPDVAESEGDAFLLECTECNFELFSGPVGIGWHRTREAAIADWNRRPAEDWIRQSAETLQASLATERAAREAAQGELDAAESDIDTLTDHNIELQAQLSALRSRCEGLEATWRDKSESMLYTRPERDSFRICADALRELLSAGGAADG